ncbi:MAG: hypothetical protein AAGU11_09280 [Syntrophobacteraceae bacterium]
MPFDHTKVPEDLRTKIEDYIDRGLTDADIAAKIREAAKEANITQTDELMWSIGSIRHRHSS